MRPLFSAALEVEGIAPFRALDKLAKRGIFVFGVQKLSPTRLKIRVKSKETQKVFAIFRGSCYTVTEAKNESLARLVSAAAKRPGAVVAAAVFVALIALGSSFVFRIDVVGSAAYRRTAACTALRPPQRRKTAFCRCPASCSRRAKRAARS